MIDGIIRNNLVKLVFPNSLISKVCDVIDTIDSFCNAICEKAIAALHRPWCRYLHDEFCS